MARPLGAADSAPLSILILGGFSLRVNGETLTDDINRSLKLWSVLAYLILHRDRPVPQAELIHTFWGDETGANPSNALKTLLYRIRAMLEPLFGDGVEPILARRGSYMWNSAIPCTLDIDDFERLCRKAADADTDSGDRRTLLREAIRLFRGDLLPKLNHQVWLVPLTIHYHAMYINAVKTLCELLGQSEEFEEMYTVASAAGLLDCLDEGLHALIVRALLRMGRNSDALVHYEQAAEQLFSSLGVHPSDELCALYQEITSAEASLKTDLSTIVDDLYEAASRPGALYCDYSFFKEAYRLEVCRAIRGGLCAHLALITVSNPDGSAPPENLLSAAMDQLQGLLVKNLRRGDIASKFSQTQFVVILPAANHEDSTMVLNRVVASFYRQPRRKFLKLTACIHKLDFA